MNLKQHPRHLEIWVSEDGRVFRELIPSADDAGYHQIRNGKFRERRHVLVAETWVGPKPFPTAVVRHKDDDPGNDLPGNLIWGTQLENIQDCIAHGRFPVAEAHHSAKLTNAQAAEIRMRREAGESGKALAEEFDVSQATVCDIKAGRSWGSV